MSLLKISSKDKLEFQKQSYQNLCNSILEVDGDYLPAWYFETSKVYSSAELQEINYNKLNSNKEIVVDKSTVITITPSVGNGFLYAAKKGYTLETGKIYRIKISVYSGSAGYSYYSELFKKI